MDDARMARLMAYCRLDELGEGEEDLLRAMLSTAEGYLMAAGVDKPAAGDPRAWVYESVCNALVLDDWDNRGSQAVGYTITENPAFRRKLNQLKLTVPILGTEV